jgi:hypothetical protein
VTHVKLWQSMRTALRHWRTMCNRTQASAPPPPRGDDDDNHGATLTLEDKAMASARALAEKERQLLVLADRVRRLELELMPSTLCTNVQHDDDTPRVRVRLSPATAKLSTVLEHQHTETASSSCVKQRTQTQTCQEVEMSTAYKDRSEQMQVKSSWSPAVRPHGREYLQTSPYMRGTPGRDATMQCSVYSCGPGMVHDSPMEKTVAQHTSWSLSPTGINSHGHTEVCPINILLPRLCAVAYLILHTCSFCVSTFACSSTALLWKGMRTCCTVSLCMWCHACAGTIRST